MFLYLQVITEAYLEPFHVSLMQTCQTSRSLPVCQFFLPELPVGSFETQYLISKLLYPFSKAHFHKLNYSPKKHCRPGNYWTEYYSI